MQEQVTRDEYLDRIERSWRDVDRLVADLDAAALRKPVADDWTVQDHLTHIAAWEKSLVALLEGADRAAAMDAPGLDDAGTDAINAVVHERHRETPAEQALADLRETHRRLVETLRGLSDEDLSQPYSHFQPGVDDEDHARPVSNWIAGNTWDHYAEHLDCIRRALG